MTRNILVLIPVLTFLVACDKEPTPDAETTKEVAAKEEPTKEPPVQEQEPAEEPAKEAPTADGKKPHPGEPNLSCSEDADCVTTSLTYNGDGATGECCPGCGGTLSNKEYGAALEAYCEDYGQRSCAKVRCEKLYETEIKCVEGTCTSVRLDENK